MAELRSRRSNRALRETEAYGVDVEAGEDTALILAIDALTTRD